MDIEKVLDSGQPKQRLRRIEKDLPDIRRELEEIYQKHNENIYIGKQNELEDCKKILQGMLGNPQYIYQVSTRIKTPNSLVKKIIKKLYEGKKSYRRINADNYNKILTDLLGVRIIHKFPDEWKDINKLIYDLFFKGEDKFITDYLKEYDPNPDSPFLVESPVVYHLPDEDLSMYLEVERKAGKSLFTYKPTENYRSVHYIINCQGVYCEVQVRTLSDELWGEIEHDFVYKQEISTTKDKLSEAATLLRIILSASDDVSMYMKEQVKGHEDVAKQYWKLCRNKISEASELLKKEGI